MKKFTLLLLAAFAVVLSWAQAPEGDSRVYKRSGDCYYPQQNSQGEYEAVPGLQGGTINVVFAANNEVYLQDPVYGYQHGVYVKGKLSEDGTLITVDLPQTLDKEGQIILGVGKLEAQKIIFNTEVKSVTYTVDEANKTIKLNGATSTEPLGVFWADFLDYGGYAEWDTEMVLYKQDYVAVEVPAGLTTTNMDLRADGQLIVGTKAAVGLVGTDIYVKGLVPMLPEAWAKGQVRNDSLVVFPVQFLGFDASMKPCYLGAVGSNGKTLVPFSMLKNRELGSYAANDNKMVLSGSDVEPIVKADYVGLYIGEVPALQTVPAEFDRLLTLPYTGTLSSAEGNVEINGKVMVGFKDDKVYMKGLLREAPESWIVGTYDQYNHLVSFEQGQYVGFDSKGVNYVVGDNWNPFFVSGLKMDDILFTLDEKKDVLTLYNNLYVNGRKSILNYRSMLNHGLVIGYNYDDKWEASQQGYENGMEVTTFKIGTGLTVTVDKGEGSLVPKYYTADSSLRLYAGNSLTLSSEGMALSKVIFMLTGNEKQMNLQTEDGEYTFEDGVGTWEGRNVQITFTVPNASGMQARIQNIMVNYYDYSRIAVEQPVGLDSYWEYEVSATDWMYDEKKFEVGVGFKGTEVYFKGLSHTYAPEAWVMGTLIGNKVLVPGWLLGQHESEYAGDEDFPVVFSGAEFDFNPETGEFKSSHYYCGSATNPMYGAMGPDGYYEVVLTRVKELEGISGVNAAKDGKTEYYDLQGRRAGESSKGLLIKQVRMSDGTVKTMKELHK